MTLTLKSALAAALGRVRGRFDQMIDPGAFCSRPGWYGAAAVVVSALAGFYYYTFSVVGTDDAFIYFRIARHIQEGAGPVLNAGDTHTPATSVLWAYVLAWTSTLFSTGEMPAISRVLATVFVSFSCLLLSYSFRRSMGVLAILAPGALVSIPLFRAVLGLEIPLAIFGLCLAHWCYFSLRSPAAAAAALAFAYFCRGDAVLLGIPIGLLVLFGKEARAEASILDRVLRATLAFGAVFLLGLGLQYLVTGQILPATLHAKVVQGRGPWATYGEVVLSYVYEALAYRWLFAGVALTGLLASRMAGASLLVIAFLHWIAYALLSVANYPWYSWLIALSLRLVIAFGAGALLMLCGFGLARYVSNVFNFAQLERSKTVSRGLLAVTLGIVSGFLLEIPVVKRFEHDPALAGNSYHKTYYEIAGHACRNPVKLDKDRSRSEIFLAQEIGLIGYFCPQLEMRDVNGLASPEVTSETLNSWSYWIAFYEPRYLCMRGTLGEELFFSNADGARFRYLRKIFHLKYNFPISLYEQVPGRLLLGNLGWPDVLELGGGRFRVELEWRDFQGGTGAGLVPRVEGRPVDAVALRSQDSAVLEFFSPGNWEMLAKVLDGRRANGHFWVFLASATNVELTTTITDTSCGEVRTYRNPLGTAAPAVTDVKAFDGCTSPRPPSCDAAAGAICLGEDGRFQLEVAWRDFEGQTGAGRQVHLPRAGGTRSRDSGLFYFFNPENWEVLVKVLDACRINDHFFVFSAATTNVEYRLTVTDTATGAVRTYTNPPGAAAAAVTDVTAFACDGTAGDSPR